jgi:hypothetical protein
MARSAEKSGVLEGVRVNVGVDVAVAVVVEVCEGIGDSVGIGVAVSTGLGFDVEVETRGKYTNGFVGLGETKGVFVTTPVMVGSGVCVASDIPGV